MAGSFRLSRAARHNAFWPHELHRGALLLGASAAIFWSSFAVGRWIVSTVEFGPIYVDLLLGWVAVLVHMAAWPNLWIGLRDLRGRQPRDDHPVIAWRSFVITLVMILAAVVILPIEYHSLSSTDAWIFVVYVTSFPYLGWTFVPTLALHGVLFGRVAYYLESRSRHLADAGAVVLFAVAAATTGVILHLGHHDPHDPGVPAGPIVDSPAGSLVAVKQGPVAGLPAGPRRPRVRRRIGRVLH